MCGRTGARSAFSVTGKGLTLSSRLSSPLDKDLVLLCALPEPANVAACGRAGHSMLVWYRPLVLEKKSSSAH